MPVLLFDRSNKVWCAEQPNDGALHAGFIGQRGPKVEDLLEFAKEKDKQFQAFLKKRAKGNSDYEPGVRRRSRVPQKPAGGDSPGITSSDPGSQPEAG